MALVPYVEVHTLLGFDPHAFTLAAAVLLGHWLLIRQARDPRHAPAFSATLVAGALLGALALFQCLPATPARLGGATLGGLLGAALAGGLYARRTQTNLFNAAAWAFPFAWVLVRLGCFLAHDQAAQPHAGLLAVNYPGGPRHDLAVYEILYALTLAAVFFKQRHKPWPFAAILVTSYGLLRLALHPLRVAQHDIDFAGAALVLAAGLLWLFYSAPRTRTA